MPAISIEKFSEESKLMDDLKKCSIWEFIALSLRAIRAVFKIVEKPGICFHLMLEFQIPHRYCCYMLLMICLDFCGTQGMCCFACLY